MKPLILCLLILLPAMSHAAECYNISDRDMRYQCLAMEKSDYSLCHNIANRDRRYYCIALVKGEQSQCYNISNKDLMNLCKSQL